MKKTIFTITIGALAVLACSNEKDPQPAPKSKTELLTAHPWKYTSKRYAATPDKESIEACEKDDIITFKLDSTMIYDSKTLKCQASDTIYNLEWKFLKNETEVETFDKGVHGNTLKIITLDDNTFEFQDEESKYFTYKK